MEFVFIFRITIRNPVGDPWLSSASVIIGNNASFCMLVLRTHIVVGEDECLVIVGVHRLDFSKK